MNLTPLGGGLILEQRLDECKELIISILDLFNTQMVIHIIEGVSQCLKTGASCDTWGSDLVAIQRGNSG